MRQSPLRCSPVSPAPGAVQRRPRFRFRPPARPPAQRMLQVPASESRFDVSYAHLRLILKPVSTLTRIPAFEGTTATLNGTFRAPFETVTPPANARATPAGVTLGPR